MVYSIRESAAAVWLLYLRKSRQDNPDETVEEVLSKHETQLQEYAERELGGRIPEENIYREVVSGESIDDRIEIKKLLARIEDPAVRGVLVIEPQRLSRGDLEDCGRLINAFRFTKTDVLTPYMNYDLDNKMERKFFQDELLRGRDFLEYTKEILFRGRIAAVKRGCYINRMAPYGYKKITIGKDHTLEIVEDEAAVVRLIFSLYITEGLTPYRIACKLNEMGIKSARGGLWIKDTIRHILRNVHYNGKTVFNQIKITPVLENGEIVHRKLTQPVEDVIIAEGKHPAIIDDETWRMAQELVARNPREKHTYELKNPLSGVLRCAKCGKVLFYHSYQHAATRYECRTRPLCYKSVKASDMMDAVLHALENSELPELQARVKNNDGDALKIQQALLKKLEKQMAEFRDQEDTQYELLETGRYTQDVFDRRNVALRAKMEDCQSQIYQAKAAMPKSVDYAERVVALQDAINILRDPLAAAKDKNRILKAIVERIDYTGPERYGDVYHRQGARYKQGTFTLDITLRV